MLWDDEHLYVAADLEEPHLQAALDGARRRSSSSDNDFEVFLDPDADTHDYFELEINALGTEWDLLPRAAVPRRRRRRTTTWDIDGPAHRRARSTARSTTPPTSTAAGRVEIAIPFAALADAGRHALSAGPRRPVARQLLARRVALERRGRRLREGRGPGDGRAPPRGQLGLVRAGPREHAPTPRCGACVEFRADAGASRSPRPTRARSLRAHPPRLADRARDRLRAALLPAAAAGRGAQAVRPTSCPGPTPDGPRAASPAPSGAPGASRARRTRTSRGSACGTAARWRCARTVASGSSTRPRDPVPMAGLDWAILFAVFAVLVAGVLLTKQVHALGGRLPRRGPHGRALPRERLAGHGRARRHHDRGQPAR